MNTKAEILNLAVVVLCSLAVAGPVAAAAPQGLENQVNVWEHRFFFHQYINDPIEKRLQRLELLVFGSTQAGSNAERLARLQKTIAQRDKDSAEHVRTATLPRAKDQAPTLSKVPKGEYPAVTSLEWRALKKTYPQESLDNRLERLEVKLFGQASPAMSYADRVERLNRTLGIGIASENGTSGRRLGPMPKSMPHAMEFGFGRQFSIPGQVPFNDDLSQSMNEMFRQMDQQMEQLMRMPFAQIPDQPYFEPNVPQRKKSLPFVVPRFMPPPSAVPPYNDPNSI